MISWPLAMQETEKLHKYESKKILQVLRSNTVDKVYAALYFLEHTLIHHREAIVVISQYAENLMDLFYDHKLYNALLALKHHEVIAYMIDKNDLRLLAKMDLNYSSVKKSIKLGLLHIFASANILSVNLERALEVYVGSNGEVVDLKRLSLEYFYREDVVCINCTPELLFKQEQAYTGGVSSVVSSNKKLMSINVEGMLLRLQIQTLIELMCYKFCKKLFMHCIKRIVNERKHRKLKVVQRILHSSEYAGSCLAKEVGANIYELKSNGNLVYDLVKSEVYVKEVASSVLRDNFTLDKLSMPQLLLLRCIFNFVEVEEMIIIEFEKLFRFDKPRIIELLCVHKFSKFDKQTFARFILKNLYVGEYVASFLDLLKSVIPSNFMLIFSEYDVDCRPYTKLLSKFHKLQFESLTFNPAFMQINSYRRYMEETGWLVLNEDEIVNSIINNCKRSDKEYWLHNRRDYYANLCNTTLDTSNKPSHVELEGKLLIFTKALDLYYSSSTYSSADKYTYMMRLYNRRKASLPPLTSFTFELNRIECLFLEDMLHYLFTDSLVHLVLNKLSEDIDYHKHLSLVVWNEVYCRPETFVGCLPFFKQIVDPLLYRIIDCATKVKKVLPNSENNEVESVLDINFASKNLHSCKLVSNFPVESDYKMLISILKYEDTPYRSYCIDYGVTHFGIKLICDVLFDLIECDRDLVYEIALAKVCRGEYDLRLLGITNKVWLDKFYHKMFKIKAQDIYDHLSTNTCDMLFSYSMNHSEYRKRYFSSVSKDRCTLNKALNINKLLAYELKQRDVDLREGLVDEDHESLDGDALLFEETNSQIDPKNCTGCATTERLDKHESTNSMAELVYNDSNVGNMFYTIAVCIRPEFSNGDLLEFIYALTIIRETDAKPYVFLHFCELLTLFEESYKENKNTPGQSRNQRETDIKDSDACKIKHILRTHLNDKYFLYTVLDQILCILPSCSQTTKLLLLSCMNTSNVTKSHNLSFVSILIPLLHDSNISICVESKRLLNQVTFLSPEVSNMKTQIVQCIISKTYVKPFLNTLSLQMFNHYLCYNSLNLLVHILVKYLRDFRSEIFPIIKKLPGFVRTENLTSVFPLIFNALSSFVIDTSYAVDECCDVAKSLMKYNEKITFTLLISNLHVDLRVSRFLVECLEVCDDKIVREVLEQILHGRCSSIGTAVDKGGNALHEFDAQSFIEPYFLAYAPQLSLFTSYFPQFLPYLRSLFISSKQEHREIAFKAFSKIEQLDYVIHVCKTGTWHNRLLASRLFSIYAHHKICLAMIFILKNDVQSNVRKCSFEIWKENVVNPNATLKLIYSEILDAIAGEHSKDFYETFLYAVSEIITKYTFYAEKYCIEKIEELKESREGTDLLSNAKKVSETSKYCSTFHAVEVVLLQAIKVNKLTDLAFNFSIEFDSTKIVHFLASHENYKDRVIERLSGECNSAMLNDANLVYAMYKHNGSGSLLKHLSEEHKLEVLNDCVNLCKSPVEVGLCMLREYRKLQLQCAKDKTREGEKLGMPTHGLHETTEINAETSFSGYSRENILNSSKMCHSCEEFDILSCLTRFDGSFNDNLTYTIHAFELLKHISFSSSLCNMLEASPLVFPLVYLVFNNNVPSAGFQHIFTNVFTEYEDDILEMLIQPRYSNYLQNVSYKNLTSADSLLVILMRINTSKAIERISELILYSKTENINLLCGYLLRCYLNFEIREVAGQALGRLVKHKNSLGLFSLWIERNIPKACFK